MPDTNSAETGTTAEDAGARLTAPSAARNREPILQALRRHLPPSGTVLEIASGTGEHVAFFAAALPDLQWQPTDPDPGRRTSIDAWTAGLRNVHPALALDAMAVALTPLPWHPARTGAVLCINMIHIAPPQATDGLLAGAAAMLAPAAPLILYGPFRREGVAMSPGNAAFDADLRQRDPAWGLRVLEDVAARAAAHGFSAPTVEPMPANNLLVVFKAAHPSR